MHISARSDYAARAVPFRSPPPHPSILAIAAEAPVLVKASTLACAQEIPLTFLHGVLLDLRRAGLLHSHRGNDGGYSLDPAGDGDHDRGHPAGHQRGRPRGASVIQSISRKSPDQTEVGTATSEKL
jgi:hypothetical protein